MKILLLNPPTRANKKFIREGRCTQEQGVWATLWPPVTLATTGAVLEASGHAVRILDCPAEGVTWSGLQKIIKESPPAVVIWGSGTPSIHSDLSLASDIKEIDHTISTAVFGTHVTVLDRQCMGEFPRLDFIVRNEPEITIRELASALQDRTALEEVFGLTFRNSKGEIISNPPRPFMENLDDLPFPAWHLVNIKSYTLPLKGRPFVIVAPQRGCPFNCSFCTCQTYYGKKLRKRAVSHIIAEIEYDMSRFKVRDFFFWSETFVVDKNYVAELCRAIIDRGLGISWTCNSRIDIVDRELLRLMAQAGCWMISYGIESGEQKVLDAVQKGTRAEQAYPAVQLAKEAGIKTAGHFIFGLPGETPHSMKKTIRLSQRLGLDIAQFYCCVPFPGSRLYDQAIREGWIQDNEFSSFTQGQAILRLPTVSADQVNRSRSRAYRSFYSRPASWYRIARLLDVRGLKKFWKIALDFLSWSR